MRRFSLKHIANPNPAKLRQHEFLQRDGDALDAIWKALDSLAAQGIDIGEAAVKELCARKEIKARYPKE